MTDLDTLQQKIQKLEQTITPATPARQQDSGAAIGLKLGSEMLGGVIAGFGLGFGADWLFGTKPIFTVVMAFLGVGAGMLNVWRFLNASTFSSAEKVATTISEEQNHHGQSAQTVRDSNDRPT